MASDIIWAACALSCCGVFGYLGAHATNILAVTLRHAIDARRNETDVAEHLAAMEGIQNAMEGAIKASSDEVRTLRNEVRSLKDSKSWRGN